MRCVDLGVVRVATHRYPPLTARRTSTLIRDCDRGVYQLLLNLRGDARVVQNRGAARVATGEFALVDCSRPFRGSHVVEPPGRAESMSVVVSRPFLPLPSRQLAELTAVSLSGRDGIGAVLRYHLIELITHPERYQPSEASRLGTVTLDLVLAMLAHHLGHDPPAAGDQAMLARIQAFVDQHLGEPTLSPERIASANHISTRTLYRLFRAQGTTVAAWIRTRRLERCRRDLADSLHDTRPIHVIAARWGFISSAHFSRAFRAEFGTCPHSFRERLRDIRREGDGHRQPTGAERQPRAGSAGQGGQETDRGGSPCSFEEP
jgi:AraC-like DNA-binding protein